MCDSESRSFLSKMDKQREDVELMDASPIGGYRRDEGARSKHGDGRRQNANNSFIDNTWKSSRINYSVDALKLMDVTQKNLTNIKLAPHNSALNHGTKNTAQVSGNSMISISKNLYSVLENVQTDPTSVRASGSTSCSGSVGVARSNYGTRSTSAAPPGTPLVASEAPAPAPVPQEPLPEPKKKSIKSLIDLCIINSDAVEMVAEVKQLYPAQYHAAVVNEIINIAVERPAKAIAFISKALVSLVSSNTISADNFVSGIKDILEFAPDLHIDIPMLYDYLGKIMAPQIEKKHITFVQIFRLSESIISANHEHLFLKAIIKELNESMGASFVKSEWQMSGLQIKQWMDEKLSGWLAEQFEFLEGDSKVNEETKKILSPTQTQSRLIQLMNADETCECIKGWIQDKIGSSTNEDWFMRALIQAICEHALFGPEGRDVPHLNQDRMDKYATLIHVFGETKQSREASCLFGIQQLIHRLEHPQRLTLEIFQCLHEYYIISLDGFIAWEVSEKEPEGKGVMMKALVSFFPNIKESDNEDSEPKKKSIKSLIDLCIINSDAVEMVAEVKQLYPAQYHAAVVNEIINIAVERPAKAIAFISKALVSLVSSNTISADNFVSGIKDILEFAPDLHIDIPMLYDYLGKIMAPQIEKKHITFVQIFRLSESIISANHGHLFLKAIIKELNESMGAAFVKSEWQKSGLQIKQWMDEKLSGWLAEQFEFLEGDSKVNEETKKILSPTQTQSRLIQLMNADETCECIKGWIQDKIGSSTNEDWFMRALIQAICEHALFGPEGRDVPHLNQDRMDKYATLIHVFGETKQSREASCLFGIQQLIHRLEHPQRLTLEIFQCLHEYYIISLDGFIAWEVSEKEPEGKGVMMKALVSFFPNIKESDNEDSEPKKKSIKSLIDLCIINSDAVEMVAEVKQLYPAQYHAAVVNEIINIAVERPAKAIAFISKALVSLVSSNTISADNFVSGIKDILEFAPDLHIDIPMLYDYLGKIMAPQIEKKHITFVQIFRLSESIISANHGHLFLKAIIKELNESMGAAFVKSEWQKSGLQIKQWTDEKLSGWLAEQFEFLEGDSKVNEETKKILSPTQTQSRLIQLMNADETCECIKGWIQDKIGSSTNEDWFMRALIQAICEHALFGPEGRDVPHLNQDRMDKYATLIHVFGETKQSREASCLFGIQQLIHRLEHPQRLTLEIFQCLHEYYIISLDGFIAWEVSEKEPEGKGVMMKALVSFFPNIKESDNEDSEPKKKSIKSLIDLCIINSDAVEMVAEVKQLYPAQYHAAVVNEIINIAVERPAKAIAFISKALVSLVSSNTISADNFVSGIKDILEFAPDLHIDIPMLYDYLGKIMAPQIEKKHITFVQIFRLSESIISANHGHLFLKAIIKELNESMGAAFVKSEWQKSGLQIKQWTDEKLSGWLAEQFEFLEGDSKVNEETKKILSPTQTQSRLIQLMNADETCECIKGWIQDKIGSSTNEDWFMRALIQAICEHALFGPEGRDVPHLNQDRMDKYATLIHVFGETKQSREASCLFGIQQLIHRLEHPQRLTLEIFQCLHEYYIISLDGFIAWEVSEKEPEGKGVMMKALVSFFPNIKESDNEDSEPKKKSIKSLIDLCIINSDAVEMVAEVKQLYPAQYHAAVVNEIINIAVERPAKAIAFISKALVSLVSSNTISADNFVSGIKDILEFAPDLHIDIPMLYDYLGKIMAPQIEKKHITFVQIFRLSESIISANHGHLFLKAIIKELNESMGAAFVKSEWQKSGLQIKQWTDEKLSGWLAEQFEFLEGDSKVNEETKKILSPTQTQSRLIQLMNADETCECIKGWIQDKIGSSTNEDWFMRALIQAICEHALFGPEGRDVPHLNQDRMDKYATLIHVFGETKQSREASCLFGIQQLIHRLEHPQRLTLEIFQCLHEYYIISLDGFIAWEVSEKEPEGKGVMMKALVSFFPNIKEADNEDSCSED